MGTKARPLTFHLASLPDPRKIRGQRHLFLDVVLMAILAELCGADSWENIHRFAKSQEEWLRTFLSLPGASRVRTHSTGSSFRTVGGLESVGQDHRSGANQSRRHE